METIAYFQQGNKNISYFYIFLQESLCPFCCYLFIHHKSTQVKHLPEGFFSSHTSGPEERNANYKLLIKRFIEASLEQVLLHIQLSILDTTRNHPIRGLLLVVPLTQFVVLTFDKMNFSSRFAANERFENIPQGVERHGCIHQKYLVDGTRVVIAQRPHEFLANGGGRSVAQGRKPVEIHNRIDRFISGGAAGNGAFQCVNVLLDRPFHIV